MNPKLKRGVLIFVISIVVNFPLFYAFEEDRNCVFDWGSKCSNSFFIRTSIQVVVMTILFVWLGRKKKVDKQ